MKFGYRCDFRLPSGDGGFVYGQGGLFVDRGEEAALGETVIGRIVPGVAGRWKYVKVGNQLQMHEGHTVVALATILDVYVSRIDVELRAGVKPEDRRLRRLPNVPFPYHDVGPEGFPLLSGVDPYSDTYFAQMQMPRLAEELDRLAALVDQEFRDPILEAAAMARDGSSKPHHYIVFVGD
jgi:hypothetical protein